MGQNATYCYTYIKPACNLTRSLEKDVTNQGFIQRGGGSTLGSPNPQKFENNDVIIDSTATIGFITQ